MNILPNDPFVRRLLIIAASLLLTYVFFSYIIGYFSPFIVAFAASLALNPIASFFERKLRLSRGLAAIASIFIFIIAIGYVGAALINNVWREAVMFTAQLPELLAQVTQMTEELLYESEALSILFYLAPPWLGTWSEGVANSLAERAQDLLGVGVAYTSMTLFRTLPGFVIWVLLFAISSFFFVKDKYTINEAIRRNSSQILRNWCTKLSTGIASVFTGYVKAQLIIMSVIGAITIVALMWHGYQYALFMGLLIAFLDALPIVGSSLILIPWALLSLIQGQVYSALFFLVLWGVNFLVRQLLEPKVLADSIGLHPILMLVSMYAGLRLIGPLGLIVGPMWVMSMKIMLSS